MQKSPLALSQIFEPIKADLELVDREFVRHVQSQVELIPTIGKYIQGSGGKRIRVAGRGGVRVDARQDAVELAFVGDREQAAPLVTLRAQRTLHLAEARLPGWNLGISTVPAADITFAAAAVWATEGEAAIEGTVSYQACNDLMCFAPTTAEFAWTLRVVPAIFGAGLILLFPLLAVGLGSFFILGVRSLQENLVAEFAVGRADDAHVGRRLGHRTHRPHRAFLDHDGFRRGSEQGLGGREEPDRQVPRRTAQDSGRQGRRAEARREVNSQLKTP